jgi:hypothetical protein
MLDLLTTKASQKSSPVETLSDESAKEEHDVGVRSAVVGFSGLWIGALLLWIPPRGVCIGVDLLDRKDAGEMPVMTLMCAGVAGVAGVLGVTTGRRGEKKVGREGVLGVFTKPLRSRGLRRLAASPLGWASGVS